MRVRTLRSAVAAIMASGNLILYPFRILTASSAISSVRPMISAVFSSSKIEEAGFEESKNSILLMIDMLG